MAVAVDDNPSGQQEAEEPVRDQVAVTDYGALLPGQGARGLDSLGPVGAPAQQGRCSPEQTVEPHQQKTLSAASGGDLESTQGLAHHIRALIGQQGEWAEGDEAYEEEGKRRIIGCDNSIVIRVGSVMI